MRNDQQFFLGLTLNVKSKIGSYLFQGHALKETLILSDAFHLQVWSSQRILSSEVRINLPEKMMARISLFPLSLGSACSPSTFERVHGFLASLYFSRYPVPAQIDDLFQCFAPGNEPVPSRCILDFDSMIRLQV